jgi:hypothetical protein
MFKSHDKTNDSEISGVEEQLLFLPKASQEVENDLKKSQGHN